MHTLLTSVAWVLGVLAVFLLPSLAGAQAAQPSLPSTVQPAAAVAPVAANEEPDFTPLPSVTGAAAELTVGGTLLLATPVIAGFVALASDDSPWFCEDWFTGEVDSQCRAEQKAGQAAARRNALAVGVPLGMVATVLLVHGAYRVRRIRQERKRIRLQQASLQLQREGGQLSLTLAF